MKVISLKDPFRLFFEPRSGKVYKFINGECDIPDGLALEMTQGNKDYALAIINHNSGTINNRWNPETWNDNNREIIVDVPISYFNGYGKAGIMLVKGLVENNVTPHVVSSHWSANSNEYVGADVYKHKIKPDAKLDKWYLQMHLGPTFKSNQQDRFVGYTMLEATLIPTDWVNSINSSCERLIVPCEQNKQAFIDSGVKVDIGVVPLGVDAGLFNEKPDDIEDDEFIFGIMGTLTYRKGVDVLVEAFKAAFPAAQYPKVQLYIKTLQVRESAALVAEYLTRDDLTSGRIILNYDIFNPKQLETNFFHKIDCFVFPTRGEGYGLPPVEAMLCGLPTIVTNWSGPADYMHSDYSYPLGFNLVDVPSVDSFIGKTGIRGGYDKDLARKGQQWAEPNFDELVHLMQHVYNNRKEAKAKGRKAREHALKHLTTKPATAKLVEYLDSKR